MDNSIGIGDLAALATVAGIAIYVLGLVGFAIPIRTFFTGEITTAWHAAARVPKTVLAGQGARIWLPWTLAFAAALLFALAGVPRLFPSIAASVYGVAYVASASSLVLVQFWRCRRERRRAIEDPRLVGSAKRRYIKTFDATILWSGAGLSPVFLAVLLFPSSPLGPPGEASNYFVPAVLLIFVASFILAMPIAIVARPSLPKVRIIKRPGYTIAEGEPSPLEGWLVAHSDGFWHLFVRIEKQHEMLSVPDDTVLAVQMLPEEAASTDTTHKKAAEAGEEKN